jgi:hypothetical protein
MYKYASELRADELGTYFGYTKGCTFCPKKLSILCHRCIRKILNSLPLELTVNLLDEDPIWLLDLAVIELSNYRGSHPSADEVVEH